MKTLTSLMAASVLLISAATANAAYFDQDSLVSESSSSRENVYEFNDELQAFAPGVDESQIDLEKGPHANILNNVIASVTRHHADN